MRRERRHIAAPIPFGPRVSSHPQPARGRADPQRGEETLPKHYQAQHCSTDPSRRRTGTWPYSYGSALVPAWAAQCATRQLVNRYADGRCGPQIVSQGVWCCAVARRGRYGHTAAGLGGGPRPHLDRARSVARVGFGMRFPPRGFGLIATEVICIGATSRLQRHQSSASTSATSLGPRPVSEGRAS